MYYIQKFPNYQELFRELFDVFFTQKFPIVEFSVVGPIIAVLSALPTSKNFPVGSPLSSFMISANNLAIIVFAVPSSLSSSNPSSNVTINLFSLIHPPPEA